MPEDQLPVELPNDVKLSGRGPPLAQAREWQVASCGKCGCTALIMN